MYKLSGVGKKYRKGSAVITALQGVDLDIADGEWLAIKGPTGHGKSTLHRVGLMRDGRLSVPGLDGRPSR